jgi:hypothetical protein
MFQRPLVDEWCAERSKILELIKGLKDFKEEMNPTYK